MIAQEVVMLCCYGSMYLFLGDTFKPSQHCSPKTWIANDSNDLYCTLLVFQQNSPMSILWKPDYFTKKLTVCIGLTSFALSMSTFLELVNKLLSHGWPGNTGILSKTYFDQLFLHPCTCIQKKAKIFYWFEPYKRSTCNNLQSNCKYVQVLHSQHK